MADEKSPTRLSLEETIAYARTVDNWIDAFDSGPNNMVPPEGAGILVGSVQDILFKFVVAPTLARDSISYMLSAYKNGLYLGGGCYSDNEDLKESYRFAREKVKSPSDYCESESAGTVVRNIAQVRERV